MKKILGLVLAFVLLCGIVPMAALAEDVPTLTYYCRADLGLDTEDLPVFKELEKRLGIKLNVIQIPGGDYASKQTLALSEHSMGDLWVYEGNSSLIEYGDMGAFLNLDDYKDQLPNMFKFYEDYQGEIDALRSGLTGNLYGAYRCYNFPYANEGCIIREDVVTKVGYKVEDIKTVDDLTEVLYALKAAYPDSTPLCGYSNMNYCMLLALRGIDVGMNVTYDLKDGVYYYGGITEDMHKVVTWLAQLAKDGILNVNFSMTQDDNRTEVYNDRCFVQYNYGTQCQSHTLNSLDPNAHWVGIPIPTWNDDPVRPLESWAVYGDRMITIPYNCAHLDKALALIDYLYSEEGQVLMGFGIEGEHCYQTEDGEWRFLEPMQAVYNVGTEDKHNYGIDWQTAIMRVVREDAYNAKWNDDVVASLKITHEQSTPKTNWPSIYWDTDEKETRADIETPLNTYVNEQIGKFIVGTRDIAEWDAFVAEVNSNFPVDQLIGMYNAKIGK